jgi:DNA-binding MarR family transcriptional regulator
MNAIAFGAKRAFHGFLRFTRQPFASVGLTAARFDMLLAIRGSVRNDEPFIGIMQCELRRVLGVTAGVVSRMLGALEKLGLVQRARGDDRRYNGVWLTEKGEACFQAARQLLMRSVQRLVVTAICLGRHVDSRQRAHHVQRLQGYLTALRRDFGDTAPLSHAWARPGDSITSARCSRSVYDGR